MAVLLAPCMHAGTHMVKCHMAGVRWAIKLGPEALQTRSDLAAALNDAFEGQILSCGRGDMLAVLFMDAGGNEAVFPSLRSTRMKESASRWKASAQTAVRVYISRD